MTKEYYVIDHNGGEVLEFSTKEQAEAHIEVLLEGEPCVPEDIFIIYGEELALHTQDRISAHIASPTGESQTQRPSGWYTR